MSQEFINLGLSLSASDSVELPVTGSDEEVALFTDFPFALLWVFLPTRMTRGDFCLFSPCLAFNSGCKIIIFSLAFLIDASDHTSDF